MVKSGPVVVAGQIVSKTGPQPKSLPGRPGAACEISLEVLKSQTLRMQNSIPQ